MRFIKELLFYAAIYMAATGVLIGIGYLMYDKSSNTKVTAEDTLNYFGNFEDFEPRHTEAVRRSKFFERLRRVNIQFMYDNN